MGPWGPAHGAQKLRSRPGTRVPAAFGPHGLGPMGPWVHGPYQILKETYQILKETYQILKETYPILKETYPILKETYQILKKTYQILKGMYQILKSLRELFYGMLCFAMLDMVWSGGSLDFHP